MTLIPRLTRDPVEKVQGAVQRVRLGDCLTETAGGIGDDWAQYRLLGATRDGLAPAKEGVGKNPGRYKLVDEGTIFYNPMRILIGSIAMVDHGDEPGITSPDYVVFKCRPGVLHPRFFYHWLRSDWGVDFIRSLARGAVRERILFRRLSSAEIDLPSWPAQVRAAEALQLLKRPRALISEQIKATQALPAAFLRAAFESEQASRWLARPIADIATTCSGSTPSRARRDYFQGAVPWVKTGELHDGLIHDTEEHVSERAIQETSLRVLPEDTLLVAMYGQGQTRGRTGILARPATTNQACFAILPEPEVFVPAYLQYWFRYSYQRLRSESDNRGGNQSNLSGDVLRAQRAPLPDVATQRRVAAGLDAFSNATAVLAHTAEDELAEINALPAVLLRQALIGAP